jgi:hypothetical protein
LLLQSFLAKLAVSWFVTLAVCAVAIAAGKFLPLVDQMAWAAAWSAGALVVGLLGAIAWTWIKRQNTLEAAVEIDRRFGLKERVSSALSLSPGELESEAGQALARDAGRRLDNVDVSERFGVRLDRRALLPLAPAVIALLIALGIDGRTPQAPAATTTAQNQQVKKSVETLAKKLEEKRKQAAEAQLPEADALLKQLEVAAKELAQKPEADRKKTLVALNELVKDAEKRRQEVAGAAELKQQLSQLKNLQEGPAQKFGNALKDGDLKKAAEEIDKLKDQLAGDKLDAKQKEQLAKQLEQIEQSMQKTVEAHKEAKKELEKQIEQARQAGNTAQAEKLQEQLEKLAQKNSQMEKMSQLAQQLKSASQCMSEGDCKQAADALSKMSDELAGMQRDSEEMQMLDDALAEFDGAKDSMHCKECQGEGCEACQGEGFKMNDQWMRADMAKGRGIGAGDREEQKTDTGFVDSKVDQNVRKGAVVVTGTGDGPNRKGQVQEEIKSLFTNSEQQTAEALSGQRLPHDYRDHAKGYFETLREGK